jgi:hypothetical protein
VLRDVVRAARGGSPPDRELRGARPRGLNPPVSLL